MQESGGQQRSSTKELDKSGRVDELNEMNEVDIRQQVKEDEFKEEKDDKDEMRKKMVKEEVPKGETWISWWKMQWEGANNPQAEVHPNHNKGFSPTDEPAKVTQGGEDDRPDKKK